MPRNGIEFLLNLNAQNSREFMDQQSARRRHRKQHPTEFSVGKCMDGRLNLSLMTQTPLGILQPFRNLGGNFDIGWPHFQLVIENCKQYADERGRDSVFLATYHYSRGSKDRGCAGHDYDVVRARNASMNLKTGFDDVYGDPPSNESSTRLFTIQVGIETDFESLLLHGAGDEVVDLAEVTDSSDASITKLLARLYPHINAVCPNVINDLVPLVQGNILHSQEIQGSKRPPQELVHQESVLAIGRGFDWLHLPNKALIVGPWENDLAHPIGRAASIIDNNLESGVLGDNKVVLLSSGVWRKPGEGQRLARRKSLFLRDLALDVIKRDHPKILSRLEILAATTNVNTREIEVIERVD